MRAKPLVEEKSSYGCHLHTDETNYTILFVDQTSESFFEVFQTKVALVLAVSVWQCHR